MLLHGTQANFVIHHRLLRRGNLYRVWEIIQFAEQGSGTVVRGCHCRARQ
ncbi:hypothetical protein GCM10027297_12980 [Parahaliea aestuarii]